MQNEKFLPFICHSGLSGIFLSDVFYGEDNTDSGQAGMTTVPHVIWKRLTL
jgi:hypothetical protein